MSEKPAEKPKIIIDEDWKTQVQAEKEKIQRESQSRPEPDDSHPSDHEKRALPPASLASLISTLATQALIGLGQFAPPGGDPPEVRLDEAKHFIDTLQVLEEKTASHRTQQESNMLTKVLFDLRMAFVAVRDGEIPSA